MKRTELLTRLHERGCVFIREGGSVGTIRSETGDRFEVRVQKTREARDLIVLSKAAGRCLEANGKDTVETDMNPDDGTTAAVLLATIALVWRIKSFHLHPQSL